MSFISDVKKTVGVIRDIGKVTYGPLSPLELPASQKGLVNKGILRYPLDVSDSSVYPHTVEFQAWLPDTVNISELAGPEIVADRLGKLTEVTGLKTAKRTLQSGLNTAGEFLNKATGGLIGGPGGLIDIPPVTKEVEKAAPTTPQFNGPRVNQNQAFNSRLFDFTRRATKSDLFALYLPHASWDDTVSNNYSAESLTEALGATGLLAEAGTSFVQGTMESQAFINKILSGVGAVFNSPSAMEVAAKIVGGETLAKAGLQAQGYAINPQQELLYGGTNFREFMFDFTMTPRNEKEAEEIREIIKRFKYHASPAFTNNQGRFIIPPSYFDISFRFNGVRNYNLPLISTCALREVKVNYSGGLDQWATYDKGMPIQVNMILSFVELEMMHKELRLQGY